MKDSLLEFALRRLRSGLWHTTRAYRYRAIVETGKILPEPGIPESERYGTICGPTGYPFVRSLGGVSLFDFQAFDAEDYSERFPLSSWRTFVPYHRDWGEAVWIEIDREAILEGLIEPEALLELWKDTSSGRRIMPMIEAAHIGPVPANAFKHVLSISPAGVVPVA